MRAITSDVGRFVSFLNALPTSDDVKEWILHFREAFRTLLGDVDRVGVNINVACDPTGEREEYDFTLFCMQSMVLPARPAPDATPDLSIGVRPAGGHHYDRLLEVSFKRLRKEDFHPVRAFDYEREGAYLGSLLLWRERRNAPISAETLRLVEELRPFIVFAFSDAIHRFRSSRPGHGTLDRLSAILRREVGLTEREWEVLQLHMSGMTYKQIADSLSLSVIAVKKRIGAIHRKAGVDNQFELFARYFSERMFEPPTIYNAAPE